MGKGLGYGVISHKYLRRCSVEIKRQDAWKMTHLFIQWKWASKRNCIPKCENLWNWPVWGKFPKYGTIKHEKCKWILQYIWGEMYDEGTKVAPRLSVSWIRQYIYHCRFNN